MGPAAGCQNVVATQCLSTLPQVCDATQIQRRIQGKSTGQGVLYSPAGSTAYRQLREQSQLCSCHESLSECQVLGMLCLEGERTADKAFI